jgi:hypothetical protein
MLTEACQEGGITQDPSEKIMSPCTFDVKFHLSTQFTFGSLMFAASEDGILRMLPPGSAPEHLTSADVQASWSLTTTSTLDDAYSGLNPFAGLYIRTAKIFRGIPIVMSTLQLLVRALSSSSLPASSDPDLSDDYPKIEISAYGDSAGEGCLIFMVALNGDPSHNISSRYPTIGRLKASDARTPNDGMIRNLNLDLNTIRLQTIIESIQRMTPECSPLVALAQQGADVANAVVAQLSIGNPRGEPSVSNRSDDRKKRA